MASILEVLLTTHYFPDEIPSTFNTTELAKMSLKTIAKTLDKNKANSPVTRGFHLDIPLGPARRRRLTIPNPKSHLTLCREIHDNWPEIDAVHKKSKYSVITPMDWDYQELRDRLAHEDSKRERIIRSHEFGYLVQADIQGYYESIYTHSLAWAVHGKKLAKKKIGDLSLVGNRLDVAAQRAQDNQTNGLPISPKTSLILSELIGSAIDEEIAGRLHKEGIETFGQRAVDDFKFYVRTAEHAERTLAIVQSVAAEFHLRLNPAKTNVVRLPETINAAWVGQLRSMAKALSNSADLDAIVDYFSAGFELAHAFPQDSVLRFLVARLLEFRPKISKPEWPVLESLLLKTAGSDGRACDLVHRLLVFYKSQAMPVDSSRIGKAASAIVEQALSRQHEFEATWGLYLHLAWKQPLSESALERLEKARHPLLMLSALCLGAKKLLPRPLNHGEWLLTLDNETLDGEYWLVLYEVSTRKWLPLASDPVTGDPFYLALRNGGVSFISV